MGNVNNQVLMNVLDLYYETNEIGYLNEAQHIANACGLYDVLDDIASEFHYLRTLERINKYRKDVRRYVP